MPTTSLGISAPSGPSIQKPTAPPVPYRFEDLGEDEFAGAQRRLPEIWSIDRKELPARYTFCQYRFRFEQIEVLKYKFDLMVRQLVVPVLAVLAAASVRAQTLAGIDVTGSKRLPVAAITKATRLRISQHVSKDDLEKATHTLFDTGFFTAVNYRYQTKPTPKGPAWSVTFEVVEDRADTVARLDIPGFEEEKLRQDLKLADGLLDVHLPSNEQAADYYRRAIEDFLTKAGHPHKLDVSTAVDFTTRQIQTVFIPSDLPEVTEVRFEGNQVVDTERLQAATARLIVGGKHSERELRSVIELNLRPLYEEGGYLTVAFPSVKLAGSAAAVQVVEGPLWTLGRVSLNGDALPSEPMLKAGAFAEGKPANWKLFLECVTKMEKVLRRDGYLGVSSKPERQFHESDRIVDVRIDVRKGQQFLFGSLELHGLTPPDEEITRPLWKLAAGAPMDEPYIDDFWHEVNQALHGSVKSMSIQMRPHPGANIVDVVLTFK